MQVQKNIYGHKSSMFQPVKHVSFQPRASKKRGLKHKHGYTIKKQHTLCIKGAVCNSNTLYVRCSEYHLTVHYLSVLCAKNIQCSYTALAVFMERILCGSDQATQHYAATLPLSRPPS